MKPKYDGQIRPNLKERKYGQPDTEGNIRYWREYWDGVSSDVDISETEPDETS